jgi:hypothetical protein
MRKLTISFIVWIAIFLIISSPLTAEKISLKISYNSASVSKSDLNTWIDSYNVFWIDWQAHTNGQLEGQFDSLNYGPKYEVELRIPLFAGFALNLGGSHFSNASEGNISFDNSMLNQSERDSIRNEIQGIPVRFGLSYSLALPFSDKFYVFAGVGRHITFLKYKFTGNTELTIGSSMVYRLKRDYTYNSEAIGFYATFGIEYDLIKPIAIVVEAEKVWSKADGFKGPFVTDFYDPFENSTTAEDGKASLYFYEYKPSWNNNRYSSLAGHKNRPDEPIDYPVGVEEIYDIRQGEFDLGTFSLKIGIRFKF